MAALRPGVIAAVIRKDFLSLWPLVFGALLLPICVGSEALAGMGAPAKAFVAVIGILATVALVVTLMQQDGSTTARHDWLTRPIGLTNLLTAKAIFLCLVVAAPMFIAQMFYERADSHAWAQVVLASLSQLTTGLLVIVPVVVLGLVTGSLVEASVVAFSLIVLAIVTANTLRVDTINGAGPLWIADVLSQGLGLLFCLAALAMLFLRKNPSAARAVWIVGAVVVFVVSRYFPAGAATALQQLGSPKSTAAEALTTAVAEPCASDGKLRSKLTVLNAPQGWRVDVDHLSVQYLTTDAKVLRRAKAQAWPDGEAGHGAQFAAEGPRPKAAPASMRWTYALTLLEPRVSRDLVADGKRRFIPGLGYCEATRYPGAVEAVCFKPFSQPAAMTVHLKDQPETLCTDCGRADYRPAILEGFGKTGRAMRQISGRQAASAPYPVVTVTTYEPRAHFSRSSVTRAPAGDTAPRCPKGG